MKNFLTLFLVLFTLTSNAQSNVSTGNYFVDYDSNNGDYLKYEITLNPDNTFLFHYYSKITFGIPPEKNIYGKGTWKADKNIIYFTTDVTKDLDETNTLDFNGTKARYETKSPRDKTDKVVPTKLKFYQSDIGIVQGRIMLKSE